MTQTTVAVQPTVTVPCELGRHAGQPRGCAGQLVSATDAHGGDCACPCHVSGELARARAVLARFDQLAGQLGADADGDQLADALDQAEELLLVDVRAGMAA